MDVILLERVESLGQMGEVVTVKNGYARNYLLPQKKACVLPKKALCILKHRRPSLKRRIFSGNLKLKRRRKHGRYDVVLIRQAGDTGQLYGSVSAVTLLKL